MERPLGLPPDMELDPEGSHPDHDIPTENCRDDANVHDSMIKENGSSGDDEQFPAARASNEDREKNETASNALGITSNSDGSLAGPESTSDITNFPVKHKSKTTLNTESLPCGPLEGSFIKAPCKHDLNFKTGDELQGLSEASFENHDPSVSCRKSDLNLPREEDTRAVEESPDPFPLEENTSSDNNAIPTIEMHSPPDPPLGVSLKSPKKKQSTRHPKDGRNALNYGPKTALESMLSDLLKRQAGLGNSENPPPPDEPVSSIQDIPVLKQRKKRGKGSEKPSGKHRKKKKDLDTVDDSNDEDGISEIPLAFSCPVCLDVFYNAYNVRPCGHTFCEPCLRRLAKYSQDARKNTTCPVCRNIIDSCEKDKDLTSQVEFYVPEDFRRRRRTEGSNRFMRHPLPSVSPVTLSPKRQLSRIVSRLERNRLARRRPRFGTTPIRMDMWRFLSFVLAFLFLKGMVLTGMVCLYYMVYDHELHYKLLDLSISGAFGISRFLMVHMIPKFWGFGGMICFGLVLVVLVRYTRPKTLMWYKRMSGLNEVQRGGY